MMLRFALLAFLVSTTPLVRAQNEPSGQDEAVYLCHDTLPILAPADAPVDFQRVLFESGFQGSDGGVYVVNKADKGIRYYVIVMEFLDADGKYLVSAPVYNVVDGDQSIPFDIPFKPWLKRMLVRTYDPIPAKSGSSMSFVITLAMLTCPASVRVSMIQLRYDDDTEFKYVSPNLNISTTPAQPMEVKNTDGVLKWSPSVFTG